VTRAIQAMGVRFSRPAARVLGDGFPTTLRTTSEEGVAPRERAIDEAEVVGHRGRPSPHPRFARRVQIDTVDAISEPVPNARS
jgi:hypothetical protein